MNKVEIKLLTSQLKQQIHDKLEQLFAGNIIKEVKIDLFCPSEIFENLEKFGIIIDDEQWDINGWQYDYWQYFKHNDKKYSFNGCGYYGYMTIKEET